MRLINSAEAIRTTADKDSYPHDRNVTDDLCSLIKLFIYIYYGYFSTYSRVR